MSTTASRLSQFELQDAAGTQLFVTARRDELVVVEHKGGYYARVPSHPFTLMRIVNFHAGAGATPRPITARDLDGYPRYAPQLLSLYQVDGPTLRFIRNLTFDSSLLHWVQKKRGNYVFFDGQMFGGLQNGQSQQHRYVSPLSEGWPVSHAQPVAAWF